MTKTTPELPGATSRTIDTRTGRCECEHFSHFGPSPRHHQGHAYGANCLGVRRKVTSGGTFAVCRACREAGHMGTAEGSL